MNYFTRFLVAPLALVTFAIAWAPVDSALAQSTQSAKIVRDIDVEYIGPKTISRDAILSNMSQKVGEPYSQARVDEDIKKIFSTGSVQNIRILREDAGANGVRLIVVVQTREVMGGVQFRGNSAIDDGKLADKVELETGASIDVAKVQEGQREIQKLYRDRGFSEANVTYDITTSDRGAMVVYNIDEGGKALLREIDFVGNSAFSSKELRSQMESKEKGFLSAITNSGKIDNDQLQDDLLAIEKYYRDHGYLNARVVDTRRVRVDAKRVDLVVTIEEGEVYSISGVNVAGADAFSVSDLTPYLSTSAGETFSAQDVEDDLEALEAYYGDRGYADVNVTPILDSAPNNQVRVTYDIYEGDKTYLRKVNITGNNKTKDRVIRRELAVEPGDLYRKPRVDASRKRLENTNYFSSVDMFPADTDVEGYQDLNVHVVEKPTGTINFGAGFSSIDNLVGFVEVTQTNFDIGNWPSMTGAGQRFRAAARVGTERVDFVTSLTEPWFLNQPLALGGELFYRDLQFLSDEYEQTNYGGAVSLRKPIGEHSHVQGEFKLQSVEIDPDSGAPPRIAAEGGDFTQGILGIDWVHDTRDDLFLTRTGHRISAGAAYSGIGGDVETYHLEAGAIKFFNLPGDIIVSIEGHIHHVDGIGGTEPPIFERRFLGGANNLRGFDFRDVGPKDPSGEPVGGLTSWYATVEATAPVIRQLRAAVFYDIGEVTTSDFAPATAFGDIDGGVNSDVGIGIRLYLPVGPLRLDYAWPLQSDGFNDEGGRFNFNFGYRF